MKHYTKEALELYRNREMSLLGRIQCAAHIRECSECAKRLLELEKDDSLIAELRNSLRVYQEAGKDITANLSCPAKDAE